MRDRGEDMGACVHACVCGELHTICGVNALFFNMVSHLRFDLGLSRVRHIADI